MISAVTTGMSASRSSSTSSTLPSNAAVVVVDQLPIQQMQLRMQYPSGHHCPALVTIISGIAAIDASSNNPR